MQRLATIAPKIFIISLITNMKRLKFSVLIYSLLFTLININNVHALKISEIMYDPDGADTGREWVEIYNDETGPVSVSEYKLNEALSVGAAGSNHTIIGGDILASHQYAVIVEDINKFKVDYPSYAGIIYRASYGPLSNSVGENVSLRIKPSGASDYSIVSDYNYDNFAKNTAFVSGHTVCNMAVETSILDWHECSATPGYANVSISGGTTDSTSGASGNGGGTASSTSTSTSSSTPSNDGSSSYQVSNVAVGVNYYIPNPNLYIKVGDMTVESIKDKNVIAGAEFSLIVRAYNQNGTVVSNPKYYWSMGDGGYFEGEKIKYIYHIPGEYDYTVEAGNENSYSMYRGKIIVHEPSKIKIVEASTTANQIKIKNDNEGEIELGNYILKDNINNKNYKIPRNTFVKANKEIKLNGYALGFVSTSSDNYSLLTPNGNILNQYIRPKIIANNIATNSLLIFATTTQNKKLNIISATSTDHIKYENNINVINNIKQVNNKNNKAISYTQKLSFDSRY